MCQDKLNLLRYYVHHIVLHSFEYFFYLGNATFFVVFDTCECVCLCNWLCIIGKCYMWGEYSKTQCFSSKFHGICFIFLKFILFSLFGKK